MFSILLFLFLFLFCFVLFLSYFVSNGLLTNLFYPVLLLQEDCYRADVTNLHHVTLTITHALN